MHRIVYLQCLEKMGILPQFAVFSCIEVARCDGYSEKSLFWEDLFDDLKKGD
jgi:hypothetical protein